jgi:hypothetical protein
MHNLKKKIFFFWYIYCLIKKNLIYPKKIFFNFFILIQDRLIYNIKIEKIFICIQKLFV